MINQLSSEQVVNDFLNKMLTDAGMDTTSPEVREQMMNDLKNRLEERFFATILSNLSEEKVTELRELTEKGADQDKMGQFITGNIPNADELFAQSMLSFRDTYLGVTA
jgi:hypothetical protein